LEIFAVFQASPSEQGKEFRNLARAKITPDVVEQFRNELNQQTLGIAPDTLMDAHVERVLFDIIKPRVLEILNSERP
jgi:hypothetical protein